MEIRKTVVEENLATVMENQALFKHDFKDADKLLGQASVLHFLLSSGPPSLIVHHNELCLFSLHTAGELLREQRNGQ